MADLSAWLTRVGKAENAREVFQLLEDFRKQPWTDEERAKMAKQYMRVLDKVGVKDMGDLEPVEEKGPDGPVWYEKM